MTATAQKSGVVFENDGETAIYTVGNGNVIRYKRYNGVYYHANTPDAVVRVLDNARSNKHRIRIHYGETDPNKPDVGRDWNDEHDMEGRIGNSMGPLKIPILLNNSRSMGGGGLLDHCIVKIRYTGKNGSTLYVHPNYQEPVFTIRPIKPDETVGNTNLHEAGYTHLVNPTGAAFKSEEKAKRYVLKMTGKVQ